MQEEVENRTLTLVVSGTKFTGRLFKAAIWGLGGSALNKQPGIFAPAKIPGLASVGPTRHCLPVSRTPYFCPFGRYFFK